MPRPLRILLADLCYTNVFTAATRYTPLNIGFLAQYVKQQAGNDVELKLYKSVEQLYQDAVAVKPDIVAFSLYYWNTDIGRQAARYIRNLYSDVIIVYGGPSIDTDVGEQARLFATLPDADFLVVNEGELGLWNIVAQVLADRAALKHKPIDGVVFQADGTLQSGAPVGLTLDLTTLGSPYLSGVLAPFLTSEFQPLVQTSRLCPYTCAFCTSGKNRGKIRAFPMDQVKEELSYVARAYKGQDHQVLFLADENFGILPRDVEVAEHIRDCGERIGYPKSLFFYNDKRFTDTSKAVIETLGDYNQLGLALALQTENPETLKAINRKNVSEAEIVAAIDWAKERDIGTTTELIFGLPYETRHSFVDLLNRSVARRFDTVQCHNLFIMDGIELNRPGVREKYGLKTGFRLLGTNYGHVGDEFVLEHEEVVVATDTFSYEDFIAVRGLNLMFYTVFSLHFFKPLFQVLRGLNCDLATVFDRFVTGGASDNPGYRSFLSDFHAAVEGELFPDRQSLFDHVKAQYEASGRTIADPTRINIAFGARLIYQELSWVRQTLEGLLLNEPTVVGHEALLREALDLAERERIDLRGAVAPEPLTVTHDFLAWRRDKYEGLPAPLSAPRRILFQASDLALGKIASFKREYDHEGDTTFYYQAMDFIVPRHHQIYDLAYAEDVG
ncbi:MAG: radical SAM protein [Rhodospirillaceae bacterium]|nr:radical SAM protein [Rhodospirillales bacterium]